MGDVTKNKAIVDEIAAKILEARERCLEGADAIEADLDRGEMTWDEGRAMAREYLRTFANEAIPIIARGLIKIAVKKAVEEALAK